MEIFNFQAPKASFSLRNIPDKQGRKALYIKFFIERKTGFRFNFKKVSFLMAFQ